MSPDQDINNSPACTALMGRLHHRYIGRCGECRSTEIVLSKIFAHALLTAHLSRLQTSVGEREDYCGLIKVKVVDISAGLSPLCPGYIWCPIMSPVSGLLRPDQSANGPLCNADSELISHFYLNCNFSPRVPAHVAWCILMYQNQFKVSAFAVFVMSVLNIWRYWSTLGNCHGVNWKQTSYFWTILCCNFAFCQILHD